MLRLLQIFSVSISPAVSPSSSPGPDFFIPGVHSGGPIYIFVTTQFSVACSLVSPPFFENPLLILRPNPWIPFLTSPGRLKIFCYSPRYFPPGRNLGTQLPRNPRRLLGSCCSPQGYPCSSEICGPNTRDESPAKGCPPKGDSGPLWLPKVPKLGGPNFKSRLPNSKGSPFPDSPFPNFLGHSPVYPPRFPGGRTLVSKAPTWGQLGSRLPNPWGTQSPSTNPVISGHATTRRSGE